VSDGDDFLTHAVYDPVKAHEYYIKNRELAGNSPAPKGETKQQRKARVATNQKQREATVYVDSQLKGKKQADSTKATADHKVRMNALRKSSVASQARINEKLKTFLADLTAKAAPAKQIPLNKIPPNATPQMRAWIEKQNQRISAQNADAANAASADLAAKKQAATKAASAEMKRVGTEMKAAVATARANYAASKQKIQTTYKQASDTEHKNIKANVR
jgi:hypothetical protein